MTPGEGFSVDYYQDDCLLLQCKSTVYWKYSKHLQLFSILFPPNKILVNLIYVWLKE